MPRIRPASTFKTGNEGCRIFERFLEDSSLRHSVGTIQHAQGIWGHRGYGVRSIIEALAPKLNQHESVSEAIKNIARPIKGAGFATTVVGRQRSRSYLRRCCSLALRTMRAMVVKHGQGVSA